MAIIPAAVLSVLLIITLQSDLEQKGYDFAQFQANLLADKISSELDTLTSNLIKVAADNDVSAAAKSSVFASNALTKIENSLLSEELDSGAIIFDREWEATEATPIEWLLVDSSYLPPADNLDANKVKEVQFQILNLPDPDFSKTELIPTIVFYVPLHLDTLIEAPASTHTGTLALLRPVSSVVKTISDNTLEASLLSLELNDISIYKSSESPSGFIRNESVRSAKGNLKLSVEVGVPFAPIKDQVKQYTVKLTIGLIAALIVISIISFLGIRKLLSPYQEVTKAVETLSLGNYQQINASPKYREPAQIIGLLNVLQQRVISDQSELERMVEKRTQQLSTANLELEQTLEEVRDLQEHLVESEKNAQLGKLVAGVAHELNTPMGNSMTAMSILSEQLTILESKYSAATLTSDEMKMHLEACIEAIPLIESNLQRSASLVRTFKEVSVENVTGNKREFVVGDYLSEVFGTLSSEIDKYKVSFEINGDQDLAIYTDAGALGRVISQLILNSLSHGFSPESEHHIVLNYQKSGSDLVINFVDDGRGTDEETLTRIFDPFYTTERHSGHIGLGLHIVYNVVCQKLSGSIRATRSTETSGLMFQITIPIS
ncbi:sensor histidine kinase [Vibrio sp. HN007]|uniref:sensor histidine kinase n=1 Tax=Vibrio iocasae TaxID=3098914 RepID=UPI0035D4DE06